MYDLTRTSHVLMKAADLIEEKGWVVGTHGWSGDDDFCIEGALLAAQGVEFSEMDPADFTACPAYNAVVEYLDGRGEVISCRRFDDRRPAVPALYTWNDAIGRTAEQVICTLRAAAIALLCKEKNIELDLRDAVNEALEPVLAEVSQPEPVAA